MTTRDLVAFTLALAIGVTIGTFDILVDLQPEPINGVVNSALIVGVTWWFYNLGKGPHD